ncbi:MAG: hypothetical protein GX892_15600 [Thermoanaerobacteraceae bacterium]|nr:hypothetical protein [Thermoanaerobacteraceae bacterium]
MEEILKEILAELKKLNEYVDIRKAQVVLNTQVDLNRKSSASKEENKKPISFQEVLKAYRQYLQEW